MNSVDHRVACTLVSFLTARGERITSDLGTLTLHADGEHVRHCIARLEGADGSVCTFAVSIAVGGIR